MIILSSFHNKIYVNENTESLIILNKIRSLLGGQANMAFVNTVLVTSMDEPM